MNAKILTFDVETSPHLADVWDLWNQNVGLVQLRAVTQVVSFAAKWYGDPKVLFYSDYHHGHDAMVIKAHELLTEADILIHFNGTSFDMKHLRREFVKAGLPPIPKLLEVDLLKVCKSQFRFASNKLAFVTEYLGLPGKVSHSGHKLWIDCMAGDPKAWATMKKYNINDVRITEALYDRLKPWIPNHPNMALFDEEENEELCPICRSSEIQKRGTRSTRIGLYQRYQCQATGCMAWFQGGKALKRVDLR